MHRNLLSLTLTTLTSLTTLTTAKSTTNTGRAIVTNNCPYPVYLWSVGSSIGPKQVLDATNPNYTEPLHRDPTTGGIALKITRNDDGLYDSSPQLSFAYSLDNPSDDQKVWYDLSDVFGDPFAGEAVVVTPEGGEGGSGTCENICWPHGVAPTGGSQVKNCGARADVELELCAEGC